MPGISRVNQDSAGGTITGALAPTVFVNGKPIAVAGAAVAGHGKAPHAGPTMSGCSATVRANGIGVCRAGDAASCGHAATGSGNVNAG
jgi:uncharacterized Zn-binding protein involved in type VI secretion